MRVKLRPGTSGLHAISPAISVKEITKTPRHLLSADKRATGHMSRIPNNLNGFVQSLHKEIAGNCGIKKGEITGGDAHCISAAFCDQGGGENVMAANSVIKVEFSKLLHSTALIPA